MIAVMNEVDLHCHTTASDGNLSPTELVQHAAHLALRVIAVTDHDSVDGVDEAVEVAGHLGIEVLAGVEINTDVPGEEVHVLGYLMDYKQPDFEAELARLRQGRVGRARRMVEKLGKIGVPVSFGRVQEIAGEGSIGRPHVAQALLEAGHVATYGEAFDRFIGRHAPAYVERLRFTPAEACRLIRHAGGVPVLAHPVFFDRLGAIRAPLPLDEMLPELLDAGLMGIEVYYPSYDAVTMEYLMGVARRYRLLLTGGSDFHGPPTMRTELGSVYVPPRTVRRLKEAAAGSRRSRT
jgi:predicted metal-dependent phosphoesterase TrpH